MLKFKFSLLILFCIHTSLKAESSHPDSIFNQANFHYENKDYDSANILYSNLIEKAYYSSELYLNLGNSYFKLDSLPQAILSYEKGLKLAPGNADLIFNLKLCNKMIKDKSPVKESVLINEWIYGFLGKSPNYWSYVSIGLMILTFLFLFLFFFSKTSKLKKLNFYTAIATLLITFITVYFAWLSKSKMENSNYGVLFTPHIWIKAEPSENADDDFQLHEGSKLKIIKENKNWYEISFADKKGWIEKYNVKKI